MQTNSLEKFTRRASAIWGPLTTELVTETRHGLEALLRTSPSEPWLADLYRTQPANREIYRDAAHGFVLLAHTEQAGLYRPPHDHGRSWVAYAIEHGEIEMGTYARVADENGRVRLVKRGASVIRAGEVKIYLPGDIHDTRCLTNTALLFRFTERDLRQEDRIEHRVARYVQAGATWTTGEADADGL